MKFNHSDDNYEVDTDKLPDVDAQLAEKQKELFDLCQQYNRQCFLVVKCRTGKKIEDDSTIFYNVGFDPNNIDMANLPIKEGGTMRLTNPLCLKFLALLDNCIGAITDYKATIVGRQ